MDNIHFLNIEYLFYQIYLFFTQGSFEAGGILSTVAYIWAWCAIIAVLLSAFFIFIIMYAHKRAHEIEHLEEEHFNTGGVMFEKEKKNERWEQILVHVSSENPNDWRLAIIEADIILDEMVKSMGYRGESLGERMKNIESSDFTSIDAAWEAHKVRNRIAHSGSDYILTQREARRIIGLYEQVFKEFEYI